ncbi:MAG: oligosaccharide flippase family protein, partial [Treponema sp.]|nr:oligosaccharide flippase family protein [Treponema sp.]
MAEKSLKKNAIYSFIKAFMNLAFPVITFPYASRILLPEGIGKVNFANSIVSYFIMIAGLGIGTYAIREAAKVRNDKTQLTKFSKEILSINLIATAIAYILFFIAFIFIPKLNPYRTMLLICSTKILFTTIGMDWFYSALEEFKYITLRSVFFQAISLIFLFIFVRT